MRVKSVVFLGVAAVSGGIALLSGCASAPKAPAVQESVKYTVDDTGRVAFADPLTREAIECTGLEERLTADGKLDVVASLKNKAPTPVKVEVQCLFRDADGFVAAQGTPWMPVSLGGQATETVHFTATTTISKRYTLRIRTAK